MATRPCSPDTARVTMSLPVSMKRRMAALSEANDTINWSAVARVAFEQILRGDSPAIILESTAMIQELLEEIKSALGTESSAEVIRRALVFCATILAEKKKGMTLALINSDGEAKEIFLV